METSPPIGLPGQQPSKRNKPIPYVYVAVVDSVGNYLYRLPADEASSIWPGIGRRTVEARLPAAPVVTPRSVNPCAGDGDYCLVFTSNCQAANVSAARAQGCGFNGDQGFCGNTFRNFADTRQPLFPNASCVKDVRGGAEMPWCREMVGLHPKPGPSPPSPGPAPGPSPTPHPPTKDCPACSASQCSSESCGRAAPYLCLGGAAKGGCTSDASGWPKSGACDGCCNTEACP